jgi:beta-glucosidase
MPTGYETEGTDRPTMNLPGAQDELIEKVVAANPNTIVVLNCGSPVRMPWIDKIPALLLAYYPGQEGGNALARIITGEVNPSGKLPETFPVKIEDNPAYINYPGYRDALYGEGIYVGYRYYDLKEINPLFPFGHGLSYTSFDYNNLVMPESSKIGDQVTLSVQVQNSGNRSGKEVVQLYVTDHQSTLPRPPKELKGFKKVNLAPGETKTVTFTLDERAFSFYDPTPGKWIVEPGEFVISIGSSSRDIRVWGSITLR